MIRHALAVALLSGASLTLAADKDRGSLKAQLPVEEAVRLAKAEVAKHKDIGPGYWIETVRFETDTRKWIVFFSQPGPELMLDGDIMVTIEEKTRKVCYIFGIGQPECA